MNAPTQRRGAPPKTGALTVSEMTHSFAPADAGVLPVISDLSMRVEPGELVCIVGPSGAGKTTLLRCMAGLMIPTSGSVAFGTHAIQGPVAEIAVVFQDYRGSLMPWMRVWDNVAFPLQGLGVRRAERRKRAMEALALVGLDDAAEKHPWQLSGGMQQRVAIARALAYASPVLLMDEPFGSVDAQTRFDLEDLVLRLRRQLNLTVVVVTHDIDEAVYLGDRVVVLAGSPTAVVDEISTDLGTDRDQITTKSNPRFTALRTRVLEEIRGPAHPASSTPHPGGGHSVPEVSRR
jgi:NitT/TauT family transport system ATP-binding protein